MPQYPVEDQTAILEGLNYVLSGPGGLGQNFQGFHAYTPAWITGNFRSPFTQDTAASLYVAPIALSTAQWLDPYTWRYNFASTQPEPPFSLGAPITVYGVTPTDYNGSFLSIGVVQCTTDYVIARFPDPFNDPGPGTGGSVYLSQMSTRAPAPIYDLGTDCNGKITVQGGTDNVIISGQLINTLSYTATEASDLNYTVSIYRLRGFPNNDPANPGYVFDVLTQKTIAQRVYSYSGLTGTGTLAPVETIFSTLIDANVPIGYYWYFLEVAFQLTGESGDLEITQSQVGLRSLTAQAVKQ